MTSNSEEMTELEKVNGCMALLVELCMRKTNATKMTMTTEGLSYKGEGLGNYKLVLEKVSEEDCKICQQDPDLCSRIHDRPAQSEAPSVEDLLNDYSSLHCPSCGKKAFEVQYDDLKARINRLIDETRKQERDRLTHQKIDSKIISSSDLKIEFDLKIENEAEHKFVFANSPKGWQIAVDGKNIVSRT